MPAIQQFFDLEERDVSNCCSAAEAAVGTGGLGGFEREIPCCINVRARRPA